MPDPQQQIQIPPVNTTVTVNGQAPDLPTTPAPLATDLTPPSIVSQNVPALAPLKKESFGEGFHAEAGGYPETTDAEGNVISTEPARRTSAGGILGRILAGALEGATRGMGAQAEPGAMGRGAAFSAAAKRAAEQRIAANDRARAIAQRNFENQQAARSAKIKQQLDLAQEAQITLAMEHSRDSFSLEQRARELGNEEAELQIHATHDALIKNSVDFVDDLVKEGFPVDQLKFTSESDPAFKAQAYGLTHLSGQKDSKGNPIPMSVMWNTGQPGDSNAVLVLSGPEMLNNIIKQPVTLGRYTGIDKDGKPMYTNDLQIQPDGRTSMWDVYLAFKGQQAAYTRDLQRQSAAMTLQQHKAAIAESQAGAEQKQAEAELAHKEAVNIVGTGTETPPPAGFKLPANVLTMPAAQLQTQLSAMGAPVRKDFSTLWNIGHYLEDRDVYPAYARGPGGVTTLSPRAQAENYIMQYINPGFQPVNFEAVREQIKDIANPQPNHAGGNLIAFNTAVAHLGQLAKAGKGLSNSDLRGWNAIKNELANQVGNADPLVYDAIRGALEGEIGKVFKGGPADIPERQAIDAITSWNASPDQIRGLITTFAQLMQSKSNAIIRPYVQYTGFLPPNALDPETVQTYQSLGLNPYEGLPTGAQVAVGGTGNPNPTQPQVNTSAGQAYLDKNR